MSRLGKLWNGEILTGWARDYVLWSMTIAIPGQQYSLGGGVPAEANLYHKIGLIYAPYNTWNDAGIVTFERDGQTYAYAISYLGSYSPDWHRRLLPWRGSCPRPPGTRSTGHIARLGRRL